MALGGLKEVKFPTESIWLFAGSLFLAAAITASDKTNCPKAVVDAYCNALPFFALPTVVSVFGLLISIFLFIHSRRSNANLKVIYDDIEAYREAIYGGLATSRGDALRILHYRELEGALINTTAADTRNAPRNVLLNNKTIQIILKDIKLHSEGALESVGFNCGKDFGDVVVALHRGRRDDLNSLVDEWFRYDSNAGFGRFERPSVIRKTQKPSIDIVLHHGFLTAGTTFRHPETSLCAFMRGYIKGVFYSLPLSTLEDWHLDREKLKVQHNSSGMECVCMSGNDDAGCTFTITSDG